MSMCYCLHFPNLYQDLAKNGAEIITVPWAFSTNTGKLYRHTLPRAQAIETGTFKIAPFSKILADGKKEEAVINVTINLDEVIEAKKIIQNLNF